MSALLGVVQELFWLVLIAIAGGPLVELVLRSAGKLQKLLPVLFEKVQNAGDHGVLPCFRFTEGIAVDVNMKSTGACLVAGVTHLHGFPQDVRPRHFRLMVGKRHGMRHHLKAVVQRAVVLAVEVFNTVAVCNGHDLGGVVIVLTGSVHFQLYTKIAIALSTEQRLGFVVIILN